MGVVKTISHDKFPKQGDYLNKEVVVCYNYDASHSQEGICVRDDAEEPWLTIFKVNDRYILATECQFHPKTWSQQGKTQHGK